MSAPSSSISKAEYQQSREAGFNSAILRIGVNLMPSHIVGGHARAARALRVLVLKGSARFHDLGTDVGMLYRPAPSCAADD